LLRTVAFTAVPLLRFLGSVEALSETERVQRDDCAPGFTQQQDWLSSLEGATLFEIFTPYPRPTSAAIHRVELIVSLQQPGTVTSPWPLVRHV